jgi:quercetin dioxygenase-like cupin family protein
MHLRSHVKVRHCVESTQDPGLARGPNNEEKQAMTIFRTVTVLLLLAVGTAGAQEAPSARVTPLMTKALADHPGKEALMLTVDYPPGAVDPVHRHNAHGFIYVLEGSIVMGVKGGTQVTLTPGQTFYESPNDVHTVGRNASLTKPAKFLVFLLKNSEEPVLTPVQ